MALLDDYNELMSVHLHPRLKQLGFAKYGRSFYRRRPPLVDVINFQGSDVNGSEIKHRVYLNCGIDSLEVRAAIGATPNPRPHHSACLFGERADAIVPGGATILIVPSADRAELAATCLGWLESINQCFGSVRTTAQLVDVVTRSASLQNYEQISAYLARTGADAELARWIELLHARFGRDPRWPNLAGRLRASIGAHPLPGGSARYLGAEGA